LLDRRIKGLNSVKPLQKRGLIGGIRTYNLNNQEQEFFVEFVDHRKKNQVIYFSFLSLFYGLNGMTFQKLHEQVLTLSEDDRWELINILMKSLPSNDEFGKQLN
jgi:hypothetical protein